MPAVGSGNTHGLLAWTFATLCLMACAEAHDGDASIGPRVVPCGMPTPVCTAPNPCARGEYECTSDGEMTCVGVGLLPEGAPCDVGLACDESGSCSVCTPGGTCDTGEACVRGEVDCSSGAPVCVALGPIPDCPDEGFCGSTCDSGDPCANAVIECGAGMEPTCSVTEPFPEGTGCGVGVACDARGGCTVCVDGQTCDDGNPCTRGEIDCTLEAPQCLHEAYLPEGTPCGVAGVCDATGACSECIDGGTCLVDDFCAFGVLDCASGASTCIAAGNRPAGTPCGEAGRCDGLGMCER